MCLSKIIAWNLPGFTIMWLSLKQFIAISLSRSRILIRLSIVLGKLERVLSTAKLKAKVTSVKWKKLLKKVFNKIGPTVDPEGIPDIIY